MFGPHKTFEEAIESVDTPDGVELNYLNGCGEVEAVISIDDGTEVVLVDDVDMIVETLAGHYE